MTDDKAVDTDTSDPLRDVSDDNTCDVLPLFSVIVFVVHIGAMTFGPLTNSSS